MKSISKSALDLIVLSEVSSQKAYEQKYQRPIWPAAASGVTIGIGYDLGYVTQAEFRRDWTGYLIEDEIRLLETVVGLKGVAAQKALPSVKKDISIPWDTAIAVFERKTLPKYIKMTERAFPNTSYLSPESFGALVSLVYNRGNDTKGPTRTEMRNIKEWMAVKQFSMVPAEIRSMKRLWDKQKLPGLHVRRDAEAKLFENGLTKTPANAGNGEMGAGATTVIIGGATAAAASADPSYWDYWPYILAGTIIIGGGIFLIGLIRKFKTLKEV